MPLLAILSRRSFPLCSAIVVSLACAHCSRDGDQPRDGAPPLDAAAPAADAAAPTDASAPVAGDAGRDLSSSGFDCSTCSGATPVCDPSAGGGSGQCLKVAVVAFYTPDPDMHDRAHAAYTRHANAWFPQAAAKEKFFTYESTTDWGRLKTIKPASGRIVLFLDNSPGDAAQQAGFRAYAEAGGAWMGSHVVGYNDDSTHWDWFFNDFLGCGHFNNNTWEPTAAKLRVEDTAHALSQGLGSKFTSAPSEWYSWVVDLRTRPNIKILLSVDPSSFPLGTDPNQSWYSGDYPIAWTNTNYKMLYVNMGHERMNYQTDSALSSTFDSATQNQLYLNAFRWLGGALR